MIEPKGRDFTAPLTGFGIEPNWSIKFSIEFPSSGVFPQWDSPMVQPTFDMPRFDGKGIRRVTQRMGRLPWQVQFTLWFANELDYNRMDAMQGYPDTLRYLWGLTLSVNGSMWVSGEGIKYLELPDTKLVSLSLPRLNEEGVLEADALFERHYVAPELEY